MTKTALEGAAKPDSASSTSGEWAFVGVIRDSEGVVVVAFAKCVAGYSDSTTDECAAIREGLIFALESGFRNVEVESDSLMAVKHIKNVDSMAAMGSVIDDIVLLLNSVGSGSCCYIPRAVNMAAHTLARRAFAFSVDRFWLEETPDCILDVIANDLSAAFE
ncbi:hypothetical protein TIFTF001_018583 [Ficus carica]|uniref:RNase H type-1 domain-containing protein n=1 Tax=Ficus carica TaxID=3494 RepID=A0AA88DJ90_FICCA|nr:hypothetical protein TIFTF001_018583 [Ficus carica]